MIIQFEELTDFQWQVIQEFLPVQRKRKHDLRVIINALFWVARTGSQWRNMESRYPKWQSVYYYFYRWTHDGTLDKLNACLNELARESAGKESTPSLVCNDSQSVKLAPMIFEEKGFDGNKKINGRKRQILVDTEGLIWAVFVHAANLSDTIGGCPILEKMAKMKDRLVRLEKMLLDSGYRGTFIEKAIETLEIEVEIAARPPTEKGFVPIAKRWINERTIGWLSFYRRLSKDYEHSTRCSESMILLANCTIAIQKIAKNNEKTVVLC
jgi:transposase